MPTAIAAAFNRFARARRGSVAIQLALTMTVLLGVVALGTEIVFLLYKHRQMQATADAAALGGAIALSRGYPTNYALEAKAIAASGGFVDGADNVTVAVNRPPTLGAYVGNASAVEVIVSQPQLLGMVSLFRDGLFDVGARSVALPGNESLYCMLALDPTAPSALYIAENAVITSRNCGVAVDSSSDTAMLLRNNAHIDGPVSVHGNWSLYSGASLDGSPNIRGGPVVADPYANVQLGTVPSCTGQSGSAGNGATVNLSAGHFCAGWNFQNNVTVNLTPGVYYVDQRLNFGNNAVLNGTGGVTIVVNGNYAVDFTNNATVNITAPTSGNFAGMAFYGLRTATASVVQKFQNNTTLNIKGVVYFPNQIIEFDNNGATGATGCTQVIGRIIRVFNNVGLDNHCAGTGVQPLGSSQTKLVE